MQCRKGRWVCRAHKRHKWCWEVFDINSYNLCFDCGMAFNLTSLCLYLTFIFLYLCNLCAWHCTVAEAFSWRHVWSAAKIMHNDNKAKTTDANLFCCFYLYTFYRRKCHAMTMQWEPLLHSLHVLINVVERRWIRILTDPLLQSVNKLSPHSYSLNS